MIQMIRGYLCLGMLALLVLGTTGCGTKVTPREESVAVTIKVTMNGKPIDGVTMTLQPMVDGAQAQLPVTNGELKGSITPGVYTYYIDSGKSEASLAKIPESYRMGSKDRQIEIAQAGSYEVQIN